MTRTRTDQRRDRDERAVDLRLTTPAPHPSREPWLPMPWTTNARLSDGEHYEYRPRRALHAAEHPTYESGFHRPTPETADDVWQALELEGVDGFLPRFARTDEERDAARLVVMQATVVLLDTIVRAGRRDQRHDQRRDRRLVMPNGLFDAVAGHWSDHYRLARAEGRARFAYEMTRETLTASWRDLVRAGVPLAKLWRFVKGLTGLCTLKPMKERSGRKVKSLGYEVTLRATPLLETFELPFRAILPKQSAIDVFLSPSPPRRTGDTGDGGPFTGDGPVMDREQTGDGVRTHPLVQRALELFDGEVTQVRLAPPQEASRAA